MQGRRAATHRRLDGPRRGVSLDDARRNAPAASASILHVLPSGGEASMPSPQQRTQPQKKRTQKREPQRSAQPRPIGEQARGGALPESGLSVDPDQLGAKALR